MLVFGRESVGLSPEIRERYADRLLRLPMLDVQLRSLNLANSVAVVLYEALRQRRREREGARGMAANGQIVGHELRRGSHCFPWQHDVH